jgi:hypothetical protein
MSGGDGEDAETKLKVRDERKILKYFWQLKLIHMFCHFP